MRDFDPSYNASAMRNGDDVQPKAGHIRVARLLVYEGTEEAVNAQIARSVPEGRHVLPNQVVLTVGPGDVPLVGTIRAGKVEVYGDITDLKM